jgi:DNA-binding MarR family transcriptional regulator
MLPADFTKQDATKQAEVLGIAKSTMEDWIKRFSQSSHIEHVAHGKYRKSDFKTVS